MINPDLERSLAKRMKATTIELNAGHVPMLSQPANVAAFLIKAAQKPPAKNLVRISFNENGQTKSKRFARARPLAQIVKRVS